MTVSEWLLPGDDLPAPDGELRERVAQACLTGGVRRELVDGPGGRALALALAFRHWPELVRGGDRLGPSELFYNEIFWFSRFVALREAARGPDEGLRQQQFVLVKNAPGLVEWPVVEQLVALAESGVPG